MNLGAILDTSSDQWDERVLCMAMHFWMLTWMTVRHNLLELVLHSGNTKACLKKDPLEKEMVTHSRILAWRIPWMEESGRLQPTGSQKVRQD